MAEHSTIEWTEATWNPITGCSVLSPGCKHCYAQTLAGGRLQNHPSRKGLTTSSKNGPVWTGEVRFNESWLTQPLAWKRPRRIFVNAHGDTFHENVSDEWLDKMFAVMALCPQHTFQVLTKRPARMRAYFAGIPEMPDSPGARDALIEGEAQALYAKRTGEDPSLWLAVHAPLANVWLGVSVEDQLRADERIPKLLATPAAKRFISAEPLLGPIDLGRLSLDEGRNLRALYGSTWKGSYWKADGPRLDWVIVGGESGRGARPTHPDWLRSLRDQCAAGSVPFFFKQWGEWLPAIEDDDGTKLYCVPDDGGDNERLEDFPWRPISRVFKDQMMWRVGKKVAGATLDGQLHREFPGA